LKQNPRAIFKTLLKNRGFRKTPQGFCKILFFLVKSPHLIPVAKQYKTLGQFEKPSEFETKPSGNF